MAIVLRKRHHSHTAILQKIKREKSYKDGVPIDIETNLENYIGNI